MAASVFATPPPGARDTERAMSRENVEVARGVFYAWKAGDMEAVRDLYDPDVIVRAPEGWPEPGPFVSREAVMREWEHIREAWSADVVEPIGNFIDAGDRVVVRQVWRGAGHGPDLDMEMTNVFMVRKGRIVYQEFFWDHAEALEALGLPEWPASEENVEAVRRAYEEVNARLEAPRELFDPHYEFDARDVAPAMGIVRGREAATEALRDYWETFEDFQVKLQEVLYADEDRVVTAVQDGGRMRGSDAEVWNDLFHVWTFRDGKVVRISSHTDKSRALEAAGLSE
jgi:ketosteroid isomerase-like protein